MQRVSHPDLSGADWRKSSHSNQAGGNCVEVTIGFPGLVPVRDSKAPEGPVLVFTVESWTGFISDVKADQRT
ncbi:DUF397 domain-containing protein [Streptomyces sp. NPDC001922]|uniref:DUF397 domain-containing protein n=1 Tax=Streptomyces sp. NPDC001922 TaxID=3364624 RepID=UPI0036ADDE8E